MGMEFDLDHGAAAALKPPKHLDYSLTGENARLAVERGLAEADWYQSPVPRAKLRELLDRRDGPAVRDTILWFALLALTAWGTILLWGTFWVIVPYALYAVLYATASDSRWHECGHGTAFKTDWMNNFIYELSSFMVIRESVVWRWSHTRHHSDTIIVGRDPEIQVSRPPDIPTHIKSIFAIPQYKGYFPGLINHAFGRITEAEKTFIPESEFPKIFRNARIVAGIYAVIIGSAILWQSWIPIFLFILPHFFGTWLMILHNTTQHAGLAENVLDHRLNCRTVYMNPFSRFIYWNMNYHVEHHMFPLVPYHALPRLHELIKDDCPPPYTSIAHAWREILPAILRQVKEPAYNVKRKLPPPRTGRVDGRVRGEAKPDTDGWIEICAAADLGADDILRFDYGNKTFALYRTSEGKLFATDGMCTHGNTHLADGLIVGGMIECPKHNGRFNLEDGSPARAPVCRGLATWPIEERDGRIWLNVLHPGGDGARRQRTYTFIVKVTRNVSTFIREIELVPATGSDRVEFQPGDYLQFHIPAYERIAFADFDIPEPYASVWREKKVFDLVASNTEEGRLNNYSIASNPAKEDTLKLNVRIATPPPGQDCPPGVGSAWMFALKPGDSIQAIGPFGDFHIKPTQKEMVYIGGGAGMGPLRAHLSHLLETQHSPRRISYWYGARSKQETYYAGEFEALEKTHANFSFHLALSDPLDSDEWNGHTGFIHEIVRDEYLSSHERPQAVEYYLCGPPMMIKACKKMLAELGVPGEQIAYDEF
jgi:Na+-transporting NADH:ubiquinone oxidoreductase subunit F